MLFLHVPIVFITSSGYLAPEYVIGGQLTLKADVYSFGVLILEVISARSSSSINWGGQQKLLLERVSENLSIINLLHSSLDPKSNNFFCIQINGNCSSKQYICPYISLILPPYLLTGLHWVCSLFDCKYKPFS